MAVSTRIRLLKPGVTLRTGTLPDRDWELDEKADVTNVLTRNNTDVYTPTADYHPSTKKYIDDGLATKKDDFTENTAFNKDFEDTPSNLQQNGVASVGTSEKILRADVVFPSDTSKANITYVDTQDNLKVDKITSTDNAVPRFDGTTGQLQNSGVFIDDSDNVGIGISQPQSKLHLEGNTHSAGGIRLGNTGIASEDWIFGATGFEAGFSLRNTANTGLDLLIVKDAGTLKTLPTYNNTTANAANLYITSTGEIQRSTSLEQDKDSINYSGIDTSVAFNLKPASYKQKQSFISVENFTVTDSFYSTDQVHYQPNFSINVQFNCAFKSGVSIGGIFNPSLNGIFIRLNEGIPSVIYSIDSIENEATEFNGNDISWLDWAAENTYKILFGQDNLLHYQVKDANDNFITIHTFTITQEILDIIGRVSLPIAFMVSNGSIEVNGYNAKSISNYEFLGFVAEDMERIEPRLVSHNDQGEPDGIQYGQITALNNAAIKQLKSIIDTQSQLISDLELRVIALESV